MNFLRLRGRYHPNILSQCRRVSSVAVEHASSTERAKAKIALIDSARLFSPALIDSYNRRHNYLRISLTERCNLRCFYCMPEEGVGLSPDGKLLTNDEVIRLATLFVKSGVTKIRLTGGEPTVRKGIANVIKDLNELRRYGLHSIGMTSNGIALHRRLPEFVENGLTHLNLSLDTLDPFKFELITRRSGHKAVLSALDVALASPLESVKLNVVVIKGLNDMEILDFIELTKHSNLSVRFIEFMPFTGNKWDKAKMVPSSDLLERITSHHPTATPALDEPNDTARSWRIPGYQGSFGFISSMSDHFCATCNRLRITADGQIKVCLFDAKELSLRDKLRGGASDDQLLDTIATAVLGKKAKHAGMEDIDVVTNRPMILIGGRRQTFTRRRRQSPARINPGHMTFLASETAPEPLSMFARGLSTSLALSSDKPRLSHLDKHGRASMVDVADKSITKRTATAQGRIAIPKIAYDLLQATYPISADLDLDRLSPEEKAIAKVKRKGDVLAISQLAGIMAAKKTSDLIPLCHPLALSKISVTLAPERILGGNDQVPRYSVLCKATVSCEGKTGVEMEALTAVSASLLTVWDMLKAVAGKEMKIGEILVTQKSGGRSGDFVRDV